MGGAKARTAGSAREASLEDTGALRAAFENAPVGMALVDERGRPVGTNAALRKMLGYGKDDLEGMHFSEFTYPEDAAEDVSLFGELLAGEREGYRFEKRFVKKGGTVICGRLGVSLARGASSGESPLVVAVVEDVTERSLAEEALKGSEGRLRRVVEHVADALFVHDPEGRIVDANRRACESLGYERDELLGMNVADVEEGLAPGALAGLWERMEPGKTVPVDGAHRRKDGTAFPV